MRKNRMGMSDLFVSEIGLGCMSLGTDEQKAMAILDEALDRGINYLDTADLYDFGRNEEIVGKAVKGRRDKVIIGTKVGNRWEEGQEGWFWDPSKTYIKEEVKDSLRRLGTDYIDLYQLHGGTIEDNIDETIEAFEELKQEGLIRYYGISSIRPNVIREFVKRSTIVSVMMQYSILDRRPEEEILDLLHDNNISVIARGPLAKGMLTDAMEEKVPTKGYLDFSYDEVKHIVTRIKEITNKRSMNATALKYSLYHPAVATVIPGASKIEQVISNLSANEAAELTEAEYKTIQDISKALVYTAHR